MAGAQGPDVAIWKTEIGRFSVFYRTLLNSGQPPAAPARPNAATAQPNPECDICESLVQQQQQQNLLKLHGDV
jgi:hypothetical protein